MDAAQVSGDAGWKIGMALGCPVTLDRSLNLTEAPLRNGGRVLCTEGL